MGRTGGGGRDVQEAKWTAREADKLGRAGGGHPEGGPGSVMDTGGWQVRHEIISLRLLITLTLLTTSVYSINRTVLIHLTFTSMTGGRLYCYPPFLADEETKAQRSKATYLR